MAEAIQIGPYEIFGLLGEGGMARVYAARDRRSQAERALKVLGAGDPSLRERMAREARAQRRVRHDNVLPLIDVLYLDAPDGLALVLPLIAGPSLDVLLAEGPLPVASARSLFWDLVSGVAAIHQAGLVHRDLKPSNVLLDPTGPTLSVYIADFGLAKALADDTALTRAGEVLGTRAYLAPELLAGHPATTQSDVFALGLIWCELLAGSRSPERLSGVDREIAQRCLAADPADRPTDATLLHASLTRGEEIGREGLGHELLARCRALVRPPRALEASLPAEVPRYLPPERDAFVGRHEELSALASAIERSRLVSLLGAPGAGKSRLALRYATLWLERWPGGVWFCALSDVVDEQGLLLAVARALDVSLVSTDDPMARLGDAIAKRGRCLVILDNFEQLVSRGVPILARWLQEAPLVHLLVTSRQRLACEGEEIFALSPLSTSDGVALLLHRAHARLSGWGSAEPSAIAELAVLLDGLPLAIELAAARAAILSPRALLTRLAERFRLLASPGAPAGRHNALRAALDWSWDLLSPDDQRALGQLSVFEGGFALEAADAVLESAETSTRDVLERLLDHSLLFVAGEGRYGLLVSIQQYAAHKLGTAELSWQRHARYYARFGTPEALGVLDGRDGGARLWMLRQEIPNLVAAVRRAIASGEGAVALDAFAAARSALSKTGPGMLAVELGSAVVASPLPEPQRVRALRMLAESHRLIGRMREAREGYERALSLCSAAGDRAREAMILADLGLIHHEQGRPQEARACYERALQLNREDEDLVEEAFVLMRLGVVSLVEGRTLEARAHYERSLEIYRAIGNRTQEAIVLGNLGNLHNEQGRLQEASTYQEQALALHREAGNRRAEGSVLGNLGNTYKSLGRNEAARESYEAALEAHRDVGNRRSEGIVLGNLGNLHKVRGRLSEACACYEAAIDLAREVGNRREEGANLGRLGDIVSDPARATALLHEALAVLQAIGDQREESIVLSKLSRRAREDGRLHEARRILDTALQSAEATGSKRLSGKFFTRRAELSSLLGDTAQALDDLERAEATLREVDAPEQLAEVYALRAKVATPQ